MIRDPQVGDTVRALRDDTEYEIIGYRGHGSTFDLVGRGSHSGLFERGITLEQLRSEYAYVGSRPEVEPIKHHESWGV